MGLLKWIKNDVPRGGSDEWREFVRGAPEQTGHGITQGSGHSLTDEKVNWLPDGQASLGQTSTSWSSARTDILLAPEPPATPEVPAPPWGSTFRANFLSAAAAHEQEEKRRYQLLHGDLADELVQEAAD